MKYPVFTLLALLALVLSPLTAIGADLVLATKGASSYQIVLPDAAPSPAVGECLKQTARLMQTAFQANGFELPVVEESKRDPKKPSIYLGNTSFARSKGVKVGGLSGWGYVHRVVGRDVIIAGNDHPSPDAGKAASGARRRWDRIGTAKGVVDFLREHVGVRFLYPDLGPWSAIASAAGMDLLKSPAIEFLKTPTISVPDNLDVRKTPFLEYHISYPVTGSFFDIANNRFPVVDAVFGGHTWERAVPVAKYSKTHPEYFALIGGKRTGGNPGNAQYCISNPQVQEMIYQDLIGWLDRGYQSVDLGQPDGFRPCQCEECKKLFGTGADWNEKIWIFHRNLAERIHKARPGKHVTIMSYIQTELPPKSFKKFPPNTRIMLTGTNEEDIAPWRGHEIPGGFTGYIYNWCPNLGSRYTPMRTPRFVEAQAKRLHANHIQALYRDGPGNLYGLEGPVYYTLGRMFADPEKNRAKDLVHEFCLAAFGKAAPTMLPFYDQLYHGIELYSEHLGTRSPAWTYRNIYGGRRKYLSDPFQFIGFFYTPTLLESLEKQLALAEKLADSDKVRTRLALVRREFDYVKHLARVVHLYHAFQIQPDLQSRARLLDAIDARNAMIAGYFDSRGRTLPVGNWRYTMFPPPGHDAKHMRLYYNGYQEPYANTCLNWDTRAMRQAPLPGARRMTLDRADGPLNLDSPRWKTATAHNLAPRGTASGKTTVQALHDGTGVVLRFECQAMATKESLAVYLMPTPGEEKAYRFTFGPNGESSKADAAIGFVTDPLDPRYGRYDSDWSGPWTVVTRPEPKTKRWLALVRIPFSTLGIKAPAPGSFWRGNLVRLSGDAESVWSTVPGSRALDDRNAFGELVFPEAEKPKTGSGASANPLLEWRNAYYKKTFDLPAEWRKLPREQVLGPLTEWTFRTDPLEQGLKLGWQGLKVEENQWQPMRVPSFWAENPKVGKYEGYGWYRTVFHVPAEWKGKPIRILFGSVDEQAWVYVNGQLVREHSAKSEGKPFEELWEVPFTAEVPAARIAYGKPNVLTVRVHNALANGGIWRPVLVQGVKSK